ncbi:hypothetical protein BgAZ_502980 [Babesia gibsoni]|uniref:Protein ARV n=1 Tax=Babesia gibsoni TaxID=33632 RepID=A0AAD8LMP2_BABGI|nr:hypothetical protein BgAZ_502980 [Babesia gibsoni]
MVVCVHCGAVVPTLYHKSSNESVCLETCNYCGEIADKYVEWDVYITAIELFLLKVPVFRHLIYNKNARPVGGNEKSKRRQISHLLLLFASAVVLDGYRVMVTCRFVTKSQEWCNVETLEQQQQALERSNAFFRQSEFSLDIPYNESLLSCDHIAYFPDSGSSTNLLQNMVQSILASSQVKIIQARKEMGICEGFKPTSIVDQFFVLALQEPSFVTLGNLTCKRFGERNTLLLCLIKLAGYCATLVLIPKIVRKCSNRWKPSDHSKCNVKRPSVERVNAFSSTMDILLAVLLCIHIKALVLMMIIWYPRLSLLGAVEIYAYLSNVLAIHATCNMSIKGSAAAVITAIVVKMIIHFIWLRSKY